MNYSIYRVSHNVYDVFFGKGWDDWARVVYKKATKQLLSIKGRKLTEEESKAVQNSIVKG